jgi:hypothetical protein
MPSDMSPMLLEAARPTDGPEHDTAAETADLVFAAEPDCVAPLIAYALARLHPDQSPREIAGAVIAGCQRMHDGRWLWGGSPPPTKRQGDVCDVAGPRLPRDPW